MADELDKTTAEADETTTEPEYQPLHPLVNGASLRVFGGFSW